LVYSKFLNNCIGYFLYVTEVILVFYKVLYIFYFIDLNPMADFDLVYLVFFILDYFLGFIV